MALAIDGTAQSGQNSTGAGTTLTTAGFTTSNANDIVVVQIFLQNSPNSVSRTVSSVAKTSGTGTVGTFTKRSSNPDATHFTDHEVWWALATTALTSAVFTVTYSGTCDNADAIVFAVSGADTTTPWDVNASIPKNANGTASAPTVTGVSTTAANTMLLGFTADGTGTVTAEAAQTAGAMAGTTGTLILSFHDAATDTIACEQRVVSAAQSSVSIAFGTSTPGSCPWFMIADAIQQAGGAAAPTLGWNRDSDIDSRQRPRLAFQIDEAKQWFVRSPNPVPTNLRQPTTGDEYRIPAPPRTDWAPQWFMRSPNPVPTIWLPVTGEEDRPPAQKRPPDEPGVYFRLRSSFPPILLPMVGEQDHPPIVRRPPDEPNGWFLKAAAVNTTPSTRLPTAGEQDHPVPPPRTDWAPQWFVRSPNPVPTTWLPTAGEQDRPPIIKRSPDEPTGYFFKPTVAQTTPSIWWRALEDGRFRPIIADPYSSQQMPFFIEPPLQSFYANANSDDFYPIPSFRFEEQSRAFVLRPPPQQSTIAGMAWWRTTDDARLVPGWGIRWPDDFNPWFVRSPNPVPTIWLPQWESGEHVKPIWYEDRPIAFALTPPPPPVGIAGMAWWRQTEVYVGPPPPQLDYYPAWSPQFIFQIVPPPSTLLPSNPFSAMHNFGRLGSV